MTNKPIWIVTHYRADGTLTLTATTDEGVKMAEAGAMPRIDVSRIHSVFLREPRHADA